MKKFSQKKMAPKQWNFCAVHIVSCRVAK
jgi:hypothetical protein